MLSRKFATLGLRCARTATSAESLATSSCSAEATSSGKRCKRGNQCSVAMIGARMNTMMREAISDPPGISCARTLAAEESYCGA